MTIVEFLEARISGDEVYARLNITADDSTAATEYAYLAAKRTLREATAKRAIMKLAAHVDKMAFEIWEEWAHPHVVMVNGANILAELANVYADHPDFDPAWAEDAAAANRDDVSYFGESLGPNASGA